MASNIAQNLMVMGTNTAPASPVKMTQASKNPTPPFREEPANEREATVFRAAGAGATVNIFTYRFGTTAQATRPDHVLRFPAAAILVQRQGQLFQHSCSGAHERLPELALLGPSTRARTWHTTPGAQFMLVNLAPGAVQALFGVSPGEMRNQVESISGHPLGTMIRGGRFESAAELEHLLSTQIAPLSERQLEIRTLIASLRRRRLGQRASAYAAHWGVTERTLQRLVGDGVGLTPKQVLAVQRSRNLLTMTSQGWPRSIADLAQEGEFYDQSHMRYELDRLGLGRVGNLVHGDHILTEISRP